jgi:hypothetical protein
MVHGFVEDNFELWGAKARETVMQAGQGKEA